MDLVAEEDRHDILEDRKRLIGESCASCGVEHFQCFGTSIWDETLYKAWSEIVTNLIPNIGLLESHLNNFCRICDADEVVLFERATFLVISHAQVSDDDRNREVDALAPADSTASPSTSPPPAEGVEDRNDQGDAGRSSKNDSAGGDNSKTFDQQMKQHDDRIQPHVNRTPHFDAHRFEKISNIVKQFKLSCGKAQSQFQGMQVCNSRFNAFIDAFTANTYIMVIVSNPSIHTAATLLNIQNARNHFEKFIPGFRNGHQLHRAS